MIKSRLGYEVTSEKGQVFPAGTLVNIACEDLLDAMATAMADKGIEVQLPDGEWRLVEMDTAGLC